MIGELVKYAVRKGYDKKIVLAASRAAKKERTQKRARAVFWKYIRDHKKKRRK